MQRRRFLAAVGASIALAGCGSQDSASGDDPGTDTPSNADPTDTNAGSPAETPDPTDTDPPDGFALGESSGDVNPHSLTVYNGGDTTRTVELRVTDTDAGETRLDRSFALDADDEVSGVLRGPATYEVFVGVPEAGTDETVTVAHFDTCNDYGTKVTVGVGGSVSVEQFGTDAYCGDE
jgi:hypothetical protein